MQKLSTSAMKEVRGGINIGPCRFTGDWEAQWGTLCCDFVIVTICEPFWG